MDFNNSSMIPPPNGVTRVIHRKHTHKIAFTLSEVLITLGIIGVVATLTIPQLIQNYKKSVTVNKLKSSFAILNEAVLQSVAENGEYQNWDFSDTDKFTETYILPYLKTTKVCGEFSRKKGCFKPMPNQQDGWQQLNGSYSFPGGFTPNYYYKFILTNGSSIGIRTYNNAVAQIYIDIDGPSKGESKIGKDVFYFQILNGVAVSGWYKAKGTPLIAGSECADGAPHINQTIETLLDGKKCPRGGCSLSSSNANGRNIGEACSAVIIKNSWKIPDNYPIRF